VAYQRALGRQFTTPRHRSKSSSIPPFVPFSGCGAGFKIMSIQGTADV
jgi:hypothetical protein